MSEPIKRYWAYPASHYEDSADGHLVLHTDHLAAIESARAEAFRQGQEWMQKAALCAAACPRCNGTGSFVHCHYTSEGEDAGSENVQCCNPREHAEMIERIFTIPLKDKP